MIKIVISTTLISIILCLTSVVKMLQDKTNFFNKWMPSIFFLFFLLKTVDLLNLVVNDPAFYNLFNLKYTDFQLIIKCITLLIFPFLLVSFFHSKSTYKFNKWFFYGFMSIFPIFIIIDFYLLDKTFTKISLILTLAVGFSMSLYLLYKNRDVFENYKLYHIFFVLILALFLTLVIGGFAINLVNDSLFSTDFILMSSLNYTDLSFSSNIKLLSNIFIIFLSLVFLFNRKLIYGGYYFETKLIVNAKKHHWSFIRLGKLQDKDHKVYQEIKEETLTLINKFIVLEQSYIRDEVVFESVEEISQLLRVKTSHIEFIFNYHNVLSFSKFLLKIKMYKASYLIERGYLKENTVEQLANDLGYNSRSAFFTKFKDIHGYPPSKY